jgi:hypothetical protein
MGLGGLVARPCMVAQFFKNQFGERLSPNPCRNGGLPKNSNHYIFGLFEYLFTPFRLSNAVQIFQRLMDCTVDNLQVVFAMDDSKVGSPEEFSV